MWVGDGSWHPQLYLDHIAGPGIEFFQIIFHKHQATGATATAGVPQSWCAAAATTHRQN